MTARQRLRCVALNHRPGRRVLLGHTHDGAAIVDVDRYIAWCALLEALRDALLGWLE